MGAVLSFKTFIRYELRTSSDTSQRWFSSGSPYILAPNGVDLSLKTLLRLECRTSSDTSQSMDFLRKSIYSRSPSGYGSNPKIFPPPRMPDLIRHLRINGFPLESIYSRSPTGVDLNLERLTHGSTPTQTPKTPSSPPTPQNRRRTLCRTLCPGQTRAPGRFPQLCREQAAPQTDLTMTAHDDVGTMAAPTKDDGRGTP